MVSRSITRVPSASIRQRRVVADRSSRAISDKTPHRVLVVVNLTTCGVQLVAKVQQRLQAGPCRFFVVVPASANPREATWTEEGVCCAARYRLDRTLSVLRALDADVSGEVGDWAPLMAIEDAFRTREFDEIILSTPSPGKSRWIRLDLPSRIASRFGLPVSSVISPIDDSSGDQDPARSEDI
jgi:GABA permease